METYAWCFVASLYTISAKAQLYGHGPHQFFEAPPIFTSPHIQLRPPSPDLHGVVLYLTPGQVSRLQTTGAMVRPYLGHQPEYDQRQHYYNEAHKNINNFRENFHSEHQRYGEPINVYKPDEHLIIHLPLLPFPPGPKRVRSAMFPPVTTPRYTQPTIHHPPEDYHNHHAPHNGHPHQDYHNNAPHAPYNGHPHQDYHNNVPHGPQNVHPHEDYRNHIPHAPQNVHPLMDYHGHRPHAPQKVHPPENYQRQIPHMPQNGNPAKTKQGRNIRYLPNWDNDSLKNEPFHAEPITMPKVRPTLSIPENHHTEDDEEFDEHEPEGDAPTFTDADADSDTRAHVKHKLPMTTMSPTKVISDLDKLSQVLTPLIKQRSVAQEIMDLIKEEKMLQTKLKELKQSSSNGDLRHAVEVENLKNNMKIRNALAGIIRAIIGMDKGNYVKKREIIEKNVDALLANPTIETLAQITGRLLPSKMRPAPSNKPFLMEPLPMVKINHEPMEMPIIVHKQPPAPFTSNVVTKHKMTKAIINGKPSNFNKKRHINY